MARGEPLHLAVALHGGPDVAAWRRWLALAQTGRLDLVTLEAGRLDATLIAARLAPGTSGIGLVPVVDTSATEPFLVSSAIATLDYVSGGRAGWLATGPAAAVEAADHVEVVRRLWDSWEDDAIIRDTASG